MRNRFTHFMSPHSEFDAIICRSKYLATTPPNPLTKRRYPNRGVCKHPLGGRIYTHTAAALANIRRCDDGAVAPSDANSKSSKKKSQVTVASLDPATTAAPRAFELGGAGSLTHRVLSVANTRLPARGCQECVILRAHSRAGRARNRKAGRIYNSPV